MVGPKKQDFCIKVTRFFSNSVFLIDKSLKLLHIGYALKIGYFPNKINKKNITVRPGIEIEWNEVVSDKAKLTFLICHAVEYLSRSFYI